MIDRDYARAWLPHHLEGGQQADVAIEIPAPVEPGRYQLKFDLVSEGIDWFESSGSQTTQKVAARRLEAISQIAGIGLNTIGPF